MSRAAEVVVRPYDGHDVPGEMRTVETYVDELLAGLSLFGSCTVKVAPDESRRDTLRPVHVSIDGQPCVQPVVLDPERSLPEQVRQIVCENRALLVSPRLSRDCRRAWAAGDELAVVDSPSAFLHDLLTRLVRRGFSINRARNWLNWHDRNEPTTAEIAFEEAAAFGDPMPIRVSVRDGAADGVAEEVQWRLASDWGMDVEVLPAHEELPAGVTHRVRINDLPLPGAGGDGTLADAVLDTVRPHLGCLITTATAGAILSRLAERHPLLEQEVARRFDRPALAGILRSLADEQVPVGDARGILETLATINVHLPPSKEQRYIVLAPETATVCRTSGAPTTAELCQSVRTGLGRELMNLHARDDWFRAILLDPGLESRIADGDLDGHDRRRVERNIAAALADRDELPVVLVAAGCRPAVARLLAPAFPGVAIVAYQELPPDANIDVAARIDEPEPSFTEQTLREEIDERDRAIDDALGDEPLEAESDVDRSLIEMLEMTVYLKKREGRVEDLEAAVSDEAREYLTAELELLDAEFNRSVAERTDPREDLTDMLSDLLSSQQGED
jgi:hypothetical protein